MRNQAARKGGLDISLFKLLAERHPSAVVELAHQYRMNEDIMYLSNKLVYEDKLKSGAEGVARQRLEVPGSEALREEKEWVRDLLNPRCVRGLVVCTRELADQRCGPHSRAVVFVDTDLLPARERKKGSLIENEMEARLVDEVRSPYCSPPHHCTDASRPHLQTTSALVRCGVAESQIGIIALYRQQIKLISRKLSHLPDVEILTADRSQGRDKTCIIMSLTRSNPEGQVRLSPLPPSSLPPRSTCLLTPRASRSATSSVTGVASTSASLGLNRNSSSLVRGRLWIVRRRPTWSI